MQPDTVRVKDAPHDIGWRRLDAACIVLLAAATALAAFELWKPGIQNLGDMLMSVYRVFELDQAWQQRILYPRLGPSLNFGMGAPLFQFYPPLVSYGALLFHKLGFGFLGATKAMFTLNLLVGGAGVYLYVRWLTGRRLGALTAGILYIFAPYLLVIIYERGAAAESTALAMLPWLVWSTHQLLYSRRFWSVSVSAGVVALTMLAHNITALYVLPVTLIYGVVLAIYWRKPYALALIVTAYLLGLALSAFYWLPALAELRYSRAETLMLRGMTDVANGLVPLTQLLQSTLAAMVSGEERFRFSLLLFLLGVVGLATLPWQNRKLRINAILFSAAWILILLLQLTAVKPLWVSLPLIRFIQLPWRTYGLASLSIILVIGMLLGSDRLAKLPRWMQGTLAGAVMLAAVLGGVANLRTESVPPWPSLAEEQIGIADLYERSSIGFSLTTDYTPIDMQTIGGDMVLPRDPAGIVRSENTAAPEIMIERILHNGFDLAVNTDKPFAWQAPRIFFPGWQVYIDGGAVATTGTGPFGLVTAEIPAGPHSVQLRFEQTPLRRASDFISWAALAIVIGGLIVSSSLRYKPLWLAGAAGITLALVLLIRQAQAAAAYQPTAYAANLDNEVRLLAYEVDPGPFTAGDTMTVRLYWYVQKTPLDSRKIFIHLLKPDDSGRVLQLDQYSMFGYIQSTQWQAGQMIVDEHKVPITEDMPPGTYLLAAGMYHLEPLQNLAVLAGPNTLPGDRMVLTEIEITHGR